MGEYALLSEVYGWSENKNKNKKKNKKNKHKEMIQPLSPNDMDRELLKDNEKTVFNKQNDPELKLKNMTVSPYINYNNDYQNVQDFKNENIMTRDNQYYKPRNNEPRNNDPRNNDPRNNEPRNNDPEYEEFLEYKRMKQYSGQSRSNNFINNLFKSNLFDSNDQFNELLLYVFTGVFLLMIYDNIYKLGKNSY